MTITTIKNQHSESLISLYYLLINADGPANKNEIEMDGIILQKE